MAIVGTYPLTRAGAGEQISRGLATGLQGALEKLSESKLKEIERQRVAQGLQDLGFEAQEAKGLAALPKELQTNIVKEQYLQEREGAKASKKTMTDIVNAEKAARDNLATLNRIEELDRTGKVQGLTGDILNKVGLGRFRTAETQELEKLTQSFMSNLKNIFGARPTNFDVQQYLKAVPSLVQSPEGRARVIKNLRVANKAAQIRAEALREILKANKNRVPSNLDLLIEERVGDQLDRLNQELSGSPTGTESQESEQLPDPAQYVGRRVQDTVTGQILISDGTRWIPQG